MTWSVTSGSGVHSWCRRTRLSLHMSCISLTSNGVMNRMLPPVCCTDNRMTSNTYYSHSEVGRWTRRSSVTWTRTRTCDWRLDLDLTMIFLLHIRLKVLELQPGLQSQVSFSNFKLGLVFQFLETVNQRSGELTWTQLVLETETLSLKQRSDLDST